jgi:hypothetical protein
MHSSDWPTAERPGIATVAPTGFGTFGIWWSEFPAMERRGGYSGPYSTIEEAEESAQSWGEHWECPVRIERREERPA